MALFWPIASWRERERPLPERWLREDDERLEEAERERDEPEPDDRRFARRLRVGVREPVLCRDRSLRALEACDMVDFRLLPLEREDPRLVERDDPRLVLR